MNETYDYMIILLLFDASKALNILNINYYLLLSMNFLDDSLLHLHLLLVYQLSPKHHLITVMAQDDGDILSLS